MIEPVLKGEAFLEDVRTAPANRVNVWWLGQSGYLVQWQGHHLLIDPYLSDSLTQKYQNTAKPHVRMTKRVIAPDKLDFIQVATSSHNHTDHLDGETLVPLIQVNPDLKIIVSAANVEFAAGRLGVELGRLTAIHADGDPVRAGAFTFYAIPSAHESLETDANGEHKFIGLVIQVGGRTLYHSGDACPYEGLAERLETWKIDLAMLPINGRDPARGVAGNFSAEEAVELGVQINAGLVVPCHYEMFEFNTVSPEGFVEAAREAGLPHRILKAGERLSL